MTVPDRLTLPATITMSSPPTGAVRWRIEERWDGYIATRCVFRDGRWWRQCAVQHRCETYGDAVRWAAAVGKRGE